MRVRMVVFVILGAATAAATLVTSIGAALPPPEQGSAIGSCSHGNTTPAWLATPTHVYVGPCLSSFTAFYGYKANSPGTNCYTNGYRATVWYAPTDSTWYKRWDNWRCYDGTWYYSSPVSSVNERRISEMQPGAGVTWAMVQYRNG
jgi:hypothetical protein